MEPKVSKIDISSNIFGSSSFTFKKRAKLDKSFQIFYKKLTTPTDVSLNFKLKDNFSMLQPSRILQVSTFFKSNQTSKDHDAGPRPTLQEKKYIF